VKLIVNNLFLTKEIRSENENSLPVNWKRPQKIDFMELISGMENM
jgi:hypothetical protein